MVKLQSHPEGRCHVARFTCLVYISLVLKLPLNCQQPGLTKELKGSQITRWPGGKTDEAIHSRVCDPVDLNSALTTVNKAYGDSGEVGTKDSYAGVTHEKTKMLRNYGNNRPGQKNPKIQLDKHGQQSGSLFQWAAGAIKLESTRAWCTEQEESANHSPCFYRKSQSSRLQAMGIPLLPDTCLSSGRTITPHTAADQDTTLCILDWDKTSRRTWPRPCLQREVHRATIHNRAAFVVRLPHGFATKTAPWKTYGMSKEQLERHPDYIIPLRAPCIETAIAPVTKENGIIPKGDAVMGSH
ncbi:hypothetical protein SNK03_011307 [Fusarium graminearum]